MSEFEALARLVRTHGIRRGVYLTSVARMIATFGREAMKPHYVKSTFWMYERDLASAGVDPEKVHWEWKVPAAALRSMEWATREREARAAKARAPRAASDPSSSRSGSR